MKIGLRKFEKFDKNYDAEEPLTFRPRLKKYQKIKRMKKYIRNGRNEVEKPNDDLRSFGRSNYNVSFSQEY